ncbi:hypothetical protein BGW36DRAFT_297280 [Talaromyces proteolyticus]|uniref:Uncharacterized protein n=1 Tax=Talaromyces proteolyticus TaxID=1131652 RepID=A0AAD4KNN3_9EURO|nr:uncharacterized protein BGW36DRAFT_297280 [Talaromyces proteolyticus]KAH8695920.1 hypothetical protein BGW36DRAFT_297280 [Talaromyces proteolyticus]
MAASTQPDRLLAHALQERAIKFNQASIAADFNLETENGRRNAQWAADHVTSPTLLSKEELALLNSLEKSGASQAFLRHPALTSTRPLDEDAIRAATANLKSSTATYLEHTAVLKSQHATLEKLQSGRREADREYDRYINDLTRRHLLEKQRKKAMSEDLIKDFESRISLQQQQIQVEKRQLLQTVTTKLRNDDRVLVQVERFAAELEMTEEDENTEKRVMHLTLTLSKLISEEIQCRLDRLYLDSLIRSDENTKQETDLDDRISMLEEDLDSLYLEVEALAEMSARQEFGQRIRDELQKSKQNLDHSSEECLEMISRLLSEMTESTNQVTDRLLHYQSYREALTLLASLYMNENARNETVNSKDKRSHRRQSSIKSISGQLTTSQKPQSQALDNILRRLGISGMEQGPLNQCDSAGLISESRIRMVELLNNLNTSTEMPLTEELGSTDKAKELFAFSLQRDSQFRISLSDQFQKERLTDLERRLTIIQKGIEGINLGTLVEQTEMRERQLKGNKDVKPEI